MSGFHPRKNLAAFSWDRYTAALEVLASEGKSTSLPTRAINDWDLYVILLNAAYTIWLGAFVAKDIVWLRTLTIVGNLVVLLYHLYFFENHFGIRSLGWVSTP